MKFTFGDLSYSPLVRGSIRVDGGAMFGIVPYVFWADEFPPDENHTIELALTSLLVETPDDKILFDPAGGELLGESYQWREEAPLLDQLADWETSPEEIDFVLLTHLHVDHLEGLFSREGKVLFPRAQVVIQKDELEAALHPNSRTRDDYHRPHIETLANHPRLRIVEGEEKIGPSLWVSHTPGHTRGHQLGWVEAGEGKRLVFLGDLIPTSAHLKLPYIASYDLFPKETCNEKERIFSFLSEGDRVLFFHDPKIQSAALEGLPQSPEVQEAF